MGIAKVEAMPNSRGGVVAIGRRDCEKRASGKGKGSEGTFPAGATVAPSNDQLACELHDEAVILNLRSGTYYGLNSVGARVWNLIQQPRTIKQIRDTLLSEYNVEPERCERELFVLLKELSANQLIEFR